MVIKPLSRIGQLRSLPRCRNRWGVCFGNASRRCPSSLDTHTPQLDKFPFQMARPSVAHTLDGWPTGDGGGCGSQSTACRIANTCRLGWADGHVSLESDQTENSRPEGKRSSLGRYLTFGWSSGPVWAWIQERVGSLRESRHRHVGHAPDGTGHPHFGWRLMVRGRELGRSLS